MITTAPGLRAWVLLACGVCACSTAVIFIKATHTPPIWLAAQRLLLATLILLPFARRTAGHEGMPVGWGKAALIPGLFLALHFSAWSTGARMIPAANSTLIANLTPLAMPVVALLLLRERTSTRDLVATAIGLMGVGILAAGDLDTGSGHLLGDAVCLAAMVCLAIYLALSRRLRTGSLVLYVTPLYAAAGLACAGAALIVEGIPPLPDLREALLVAGLASVPTLIGHTLMNRAMGEIRPQAVSVAALGTVPLAGLIAWILWRETPTPAFWVAAATCLIAIALVLVPSRRRAVAPAVT